VHYSDTIENRKFNNIIMHYSDTIDLIFKIRLAPIVISLYRYL